MLRCGAADAFWLLLAITSAWLAYVTCWHEEKSPMRSRLPKWHFIKYWKTVDWFHRMKKRKFILVDGGRRKRHRYLHRSPWSFVRVRRLLQERNLERDSYLGR
jgi:hypothetical protein